jgi:hypothetical protein
MLCGGFHAISCVRANNQPGNEQDTTESSWERGASRNQEPQGSELRTGPVLRGLGGVQNQLILSPTSRSAERGYANPIFCVVIVVDLCWNGTQIAESHGGLSFALSEQRVEVAGLCSSIPCFLKRELFVKVGYSDNSSLYPTLRLRRRPQTSRLRDR